MSRMETEALLASAFPPPALARLNGRRGPWAVLSASNCGRPMGITIDGDWASLQMQTEPVNAASALEAISGQTGWPGGVKHVAAQPCSILRAEVPLLLTTSAGRAWVVRQLRASSEGMLIAAGQKPMSETSSPDHGTPGDPEILALACAAGGWGAGVKPDGAVRIDLQIRGAQRSIRLRAGSTGIRASVTFTQGSLARASVPCRAAAGLFLTRASAALRWGRAFASGENGQLDSVGFECCIAAPADEQALLLAIDTLIAASELFGREAEVLLEHPEIAARYLGCASAADLEGRDEFPRTGAAARPAVPSHAAHAAIA